MPETPWRRVLVAVNAAAASELAVDAAVGIAAALEEARLEGLFVEDANLVRLGGLPFASEVSALTGVSRSLVVAELEHALRVEAARLERLFVQAAQRAQLPWSFAVTRGQLLAEAVARAADFTVVGAIGSSVAASRLASVVRRKAGRRVAALFDAGPAALRALATAARLAKAADSELVVLVAADVRQSATAGTQVRSWLTAEHVPGSIVMLAAEPRALAGELRLRHADVLVHPLPELIALAPALGTLVAELQCLLVIVR